MASIRRRNGYVEIRFRDELDKQRGLAIGKASKRDAQRFASNLDALVASRKLGQNISPELAAWVESLSQNLQGKLARIGLIDATTSDADAPRMPTVAQFFRSYIDGRKDIGKGTRSQMELAAGDIVRFLGISIRLDEVTPQDARRLRENLKSKNLAENTIRRRLGRCRQVYAAAMRDGLVTANPFLGMPVTVRGTTDRDFYVPREVAMDIINSMDCPSLRAILAMARFGGFRRCECLAGDWSWFDDESGSIRIDSPKSGVRLCPLFPDLWDVLAPIRMGDKAGRVQTRYSAQANPVTTLKKKVKAAGFQVWPKLLQNCRISCENDLLDRFPARSVASWIGHSESVQRDFYRKPSSRDFHLASGLADACGDDHTDDHAYDHTDSGNRQNVAPAIESSHKKSPQNIDVSRALKNIEENAGILLMTPTGLEPVLPP